MKYVATTLEAIHKAQPKQKKKKKSTFQTHLYPPRDTSKGRFMSLQQQRCQ